MRMKPSLSNELFHRHPENPILSVGDWSYPANAVFNAGAEQVGDRTLLLVRVEGYSGISHLTVASSEDGIHNWTINSNPTLEPEPERFPEEMWGVEDPRITRLEDLNKWGICYTAYSKSGPLVAMATTRNFREFRKLGSVMPPEDKDAALFPRKFGNRWAMVHRPISISPRRMANIWISFSPDLKHWGDHQELLCAREGAWWDANKVGLSPPPLATSEGWLILYHGVRQTASGSIYRLGLALLDLEDPTRVIRRSNEWVFGPKASYEREGDVDDVVFPCGWVVRDKTLMLYYGAADSCIGLATASIDDVIDYVRSCPSLGPET